MIKVKSFILAIALICSAFSASAQSVEQKLDSLQLLIGEQTTLHLTVTANRGQKIVMPSFKPSQQLIPGVDVVYVGVVAPAYRLIEVVSLAVASPLAVAHHAAQLLVAVLPCPAV